MSFLLDFSLPEYATNIRLVIVTMAIGILLAGILAIYYRSLLGKFVRYLLKNKIHSEECAVALADTPYRRNLFIKGALRSGGVYGKVINYTDGEDGGSVFVSGKLPDRKTVSRRKYYIPEDMRYRAEFMFTKKGTNIPVLIVTIILIAAFTLLCLYYLPRLLSLLKEAYGTTKTRGGV